MKFGDRLKLQREKQNLTREELAASLKIKYSTLANYENNVRQPDFTTLKRIASILMVSTDYLLGTQEVTENHYVDPQVALYAQEILQNPELKILFDASKKISKKDMDFVVDLVQRMKNMEK